MQQLVSTVLSNGGTAPVTIPIAVYLGIYWGVVIFLSLLLRLLLFENPVAEPEPEQEHAKSRQPGLPHSR